MKSNTDRDRSLAARSRTETQHLHCQMAVRAQGPHWGLYCAQHGTWIRWIPQNQLEQYL
jgi:hypothetical protein